MKFRDDDIEIGGWDFHNETYETIVYRGEIKIVRWTREGLLWMWRTILWILDIRKKPVETFKFYDTKDLPKDAKFKP